MFIFEYLGFFYVHFFLYSFTDVDIIRNFYFVLTFNKRSLWGQKMDHGSVEGLEDATEYLDQRSRARIR